MVHAVERKHFGGAALLDTDSGNSRVIVPVVDMVAGELVQQGLEQDVHERTLAFPISAFEAV